MANKEVVAQTFERDFVQCNVLSYVIIIMWWRSCDLRQIQEDDKHYNIPQYFTYMPGRGNFVMEGDKIDVISHATFCHSVHVCFRDMTAQHRTVGIPCN